MEGGEQSAQSREAAIMIRMRQAHSKALEVTAARLQPKLFDRYFKSIAGKLDIDSSALAAGAAKRVVENSEEGFRQLCERMSVNDKLLELETAARGAQDNKADEEDLELRPLPGGRQPAEFIRAGVVKSKVAERLRLLSLAEEAESKVEEEETHLGSLLGELEQLLAEVASLQTTLNEAAGFLP